MQTKFVSERHQEDSFPAHFMRSTATIYTHTQNNIHPCHTHILTPKTHSASFYNNAIDSVVLPKSYKIILCEVVSQRLFGIHFSQFERKIIVKISYKKALNQIQ